MAATFIPLVPVVPGSHETAFSSLNSKGLTGGGSAEGSKEEAACSKPVITLQRNGDVVSGIRVQCGCGQVIDIACKY